MHLRAVYDAAIVTVAMHAVPTRQTGDRCMRAARKAARETARAAVSAIN